MSLVEHRIPLIRQNSGFFDDLYHRMGLTGFHWQRPASWMDDFDSDMKGTMLSFDKEMDTMRSRMFQLLPGDASDTSSLVMSTQHPVVEEKGQSKLKLNFNVKDFKPDEIEVKVIGTDILQVHGKHEEKSATGHSYKEYMRQYQLPKGVNPEQLKSELTQDGILSIEAPAQALKPQERMLSIQMK